MRPSADMIASVSQRMERFVEDRLADAGELGADAVAFTRAAASTLDGGKRLRARFCLTGWQAVANAESGGRNADDDGVIAAAGALEIFHAAALVHDDIIDNSDTRRGRPAAHRALERHHTDAGWSGNPATFGRSAAILLGDLLVAWSDDLLEGGLRDAPHAAAARVEYARMRRDVTLGQYLDIVEEVAAATVPDADHAERALRVATYKSARYSVQQPLLIGAALAGADAAQLAALEAFGLPVGLAFQLRDDVLGVFGDAAVTGKPSGDDLREGKRTLLIAYAREALPQGARRAMDELLGDPDLDDEQVAFLQRTITDSGALARVEGLIADYATAADRALRAVHLDNAAVGSLRDLARAAVARAS
ncbi:MAG: polyprenyl synthetase family protein [Candidatus Microbacterium phytovorans]|uniref:Polyprenyl synthetase family protein n=1 Tax=Candidatus Microbacterium phytovorans TaxID=3121374 RepID=A0AAJ5W4G1_9MICO|nr:polyprenyl synthetase family protein [Microbacterium sp.]WEK14145.1 MAG: polyprenyl synthetase family protein [Microbacterium sp.]